MRETYYKDFENKSKEELHKANLYLKSLNKAQMSDISLVEPELE